MFSTARTVFSGNSFYSDSDMDTNVDGNALTFAAKVNEISYKVAINVHNGKFFSSKTLDLK
jgi:hypothetical protein